MRVVLDTNILISAFITRQGLPFKALQLWIEGEFELVTSIWQIEEFKNTSRKARLQKRINRSEIGTFVNALRNHAFVVEDLPKIDESPDEDDNYIIATALAAKAQYLISGDKDDLIRLEKVQTVRILTVREFVGMFMDLER